MRGDARSELTAPMVELLARAGAEILGVKGFVVGRDTRESSPALSAAIHSGINAAGGHSVDLGVVPTPAVALWCEQENVPGAVVSASHNPWYDNGVKFFAPGGLKLGDEVQSEIQRRFDQFVGEESLADDAHNVGAARHDVVAVDDLHDEGVGRHVEHLTGSLDGRDLNGMSVVIDTANGAATSVARKALTSLGAAVVAIHDSPDGRNINDNCGSTYPADLQRAVVETSSDCGVAFDGDADRLIAVGPDGELVDGDQIIAMCAQDRHRRGVLRDDSVVITVMSNLGFRRAMTQAGINIVATGVGDRYVLEALDRLGLSLGGEQSGHLIFRDISTTGDGLLTAVQLLDVVKRSGSDLGALATGSMTRLPQVLVNVDIGRRRVDIDHLLDPIAAEAADRLGDRGRVLLRASGTEPLVRVMVEAESHAEAESLAAELAEQVLAQLA